MPEHVKNPPVQTRRLDVGGRKHTILILGGQRIVLRSVRIRRAGHEGTVGLEVEGPAEMQITTERPLQ